MIVFCLIMQYKYNNLSFNMFSKKNLINLSIILFFFTYFVIGLNIFKDYGISTDEPFQRTSGQYWYLWIIENFFPNYENISYLSQNFKNMEWSKDMERGSYVSYGVFFDIICAILEDFFKINDTQNIYFLRHFLNFFFFFLSSIFFFKIINLRFKNNFLALVATILYVASPRIFAESFYNCKDIIFMSLVVPALFYGLKSLKNYKVKNIIFFSIFSAIATDVRILGIFLIILFLFFFFIEYLENKKFLKEKIKTLTILVTSYLFFTYLFWPYLWADPIKNFYSTFNYFKNFDIWNYSVFYLGEFIKGSNLPWHYIFTWIGVTMPLNYLLLFFIGSLIVLSQFFSNFSKLDQNSENKLWNNNNQKFDFFIFAFLLIPPLTIIAFNSTLYGGWRHLYFIYPGIIYISSYAIYFLMNLSKRNYKYFLSFALLVSIIFNIKTLIDLHPFQNIFFNSLVKNKANDLFEVDYWGLGNSEAIKNILKNIKHNQKYSIRTASFTPLSYSKKIISEKKMDNLIFSRTVDLNQEFVFTNYIYEKSPRFQKKYKISNSYKKIYTLKKGGIIINEIYKKK